MPVGRSVMAHSSAGRAGNLHHRRPVLARVLSHQYARFMSIAIVTGSAGLIGAEAARHFAGLGLTVIGIDNDMRRRFFGDDSSTRWSRSALETGLKNYRHVDADIRDV